MASRTALIPLDGSSFSRQIVPYVARLLDPAAYTILLLRVGEHARGLIPSPPRPVTSGWPTSMYTSARDVEFSRHPIYENQAEASERSALEGDLLEAMRLLEDAGYHVETEVRIGEPSEEILACASERRVDLVAMATHGRTGFLGLLLGSVAEQVVRKLTIPMLLLRPSNRSAN